MKLKSEQLRLKCEPELIGCNSSKESEALETLIGQERALKALEFGLNIREKGFNIFVSGLPGTGRTTAVKSYLEEIAKDKPVPDDWIYVNNFDDSHQPIAISLPAGKGKAFQEEMQVLMESAINEIQASFESEEYESKKEETVKKFATRKEKLFEDINQKAYDEGFLIRATPVGLLPVPMKDGQPLTNEEFMGLSQEKRQEISKIQQELQGELDGIIRQSKALDKNTQEALSQLDKEVALYAVSHLFEGLEKQYKDLPDILEYVANVQDDLIKNLSDFRTSEEKEPGPPVPARARQGNNKRKYHVNVFVDNEKLDGAPVLSERNPMYSNIFGQIEYEAQFGTLITDFTMLRCGSMHKANGGYLVLPVEELLQNPLSWESLKRALANEELTIQSAADRMGVISTKGLNPQPIPLDIKVILIGQPQVYYLLHQHDENIRELFKVKADFDILMDRTKEHIVDYVNFVGMICEKENLKHMDCTALQKIVEHGSRLADSQEKLSTHFGVISDVIREASYYATLDQAELATEAHVIKAIDERFYRSSLMSDRILEIIEKDVIKIDVKGAETGQVNGLSVIGMGEFSFGQPNRITVSVGIGKEGIIDIEREAKMGGAIHTKGVMILSGYLMHMYAQNKPLSLSARLVFEQSYSGVDGDSASSTELYCLLSALAGLPINQGIAVTGSVNQKGEVQTIGGVNEKIEGFYEVCKLKGLDGAQGVMIPASNVKNLMLKEELVASVEEGKFNIWAVKTIDEGIEVLTGVPAGRRLPNGSFEDRTVHFLVDQRLRSLAETYREFQNMEN